MLPVPIVKGERRKHVPRRVIEDVTFINSSKMHNVYNVPWVQFPSKPLNVILEFRPQRKSTNIKYTITAIAKYNPFSFSRTPHPQQNPL